MLRSLTGTLTDAGGIVIASLLGGFIGKHMDERYKQLLIAMLGFIALAVGFQSFATYMAKSNYAVLFIIAMILGTTLGTWLDLDGHVNRLASKGSAGLARSIITECTLSCFGALPIVGSIMAATSHDFTFLFINASLDFVMVLILSAADGMGMIVCAPLIFVYQFLLILVATFARQWLTTDLITEIAMLGGLMVASSGLNLMNLKDLKTTNQIPSLLIPIIFFTCKAVFHF